MLTYRALTKLLNNVEYEGVLRKAGEKHFLGHLIEAHGTPCTEEQATDLLARLSRYCSLPDTRLIFGSKTGHAYAPNKKLGLPYRISLPRPETRRLRVGIVLHEAAHIFDHTKRSKFGHGWEFMQALEPLVTSFNWRLGMPTRSYFEIYQRHAGRYSRLRVGGAKADRISESLDAKRTHEGAVADVTTGPYDQSFVYSDSEGSFIGAFYKRGDTFRSWEDELATYQAGLELPIQRETTALLQGGPEPLRPVDAPVDGSVPRGAVPADRPVRSVPPQGEAKQRTVRTPPPAKRRAAFRIGKDDGWPKSEAAQAVHNLFGTVAESKVLTCAEICEALGPQLTTLGVQFPASLVSRLKQNGFLKEHIDG